MSDKIISLRTGASVCAPGEVNAEAVAEIEQLLERARSGDVQGIAIAYVHGDGATNCTYGGVINFSLVGKLVQLTNYLAAEKASNLGA